MPDVPVESVPEVVLFSSDLMLVSSVSGAAMSVGAKFTAESDFAKVVRRLENPHAILCLDLGASAGDPERLAAELPSHVLGRSIAFGPHVHTDKLAAAKQAGFGKVMSRGQFVARMRDEFLQASRP